MRASILFFFSISVACTGAALLDGCVGDDSSTVKDAANDTTTTDAPSSGDAATDGGADTGPNPCADASGTFTSASAYIAPGGIAHAVIEIADGRVIVGEYRTAATFGGDAAISSTNGNTADFFAARLKTDGTLVWQVGYGGIGTDWLNAVTVDANGDVYVAGYSDEYLAGGIFQNKFDFATTYTPTAYGVVAKLDGKTGAVVWSQGFKNGTFSFGCTSIDFDSGHLVASCGMGTTQSYVANDGGTGSITANQSTASSIYGLDPATGQIVWARSLTTFEADAGATTSVDTVDVTPTNVVVAGTFSGATLVDNPSKAISIPHVGTQTNGSQNNGFVVELAIANGAPAWGKGFGDATGAGNMVATSAAGSSASGIVVGGAFTGNVDFGGGPHASVGSTDGFIVYLTNKAGAPAWEKYFSGTNQDGVGHVAKEPCGGSVFGLTTLSTIAPIDGITIPAPQSGGQAALVGKLDSTGKLVWVNGVTPGGSPDNNGINQYGIAVGADGHVAACGDFRGTVDLGSGTPSTTPGSGFPYLVLYAR